MSDMAGKAQENIVEIFLNCFQTPPESLIECLHDAKDIVYAPAFIVAGRPVSILSIGVAMPAVLFLGWSLGARLFWRKKKDDDDNLNEYMAELVKKMSALEDKISRRRRWATSASEKLTMSIFALVLWVGFLYWSGSSITAFVLGVFPYLLPTFMAVGYSASYSKRSAAKLSKELKVLEKIHHDKIEEAKENVFKVWLDFLKKFDPNGKHKLPDVARLQERVQKQQKQLNELRVKERDLAQNQTALLSQRMELLRCIDFLAISSTCGPCTDAKMYQLSMLLSNLSKYRADIQKVARERARNMGAGNPNWYGDAQRFSTSPPPTMWESDSGGSNGGGGGGGQGGGAAGATSEAAACGGVEGGGESSSVDGEDGPRGGGDVEGEVEAEAGGGGEKDGESNGSEEGSGGSGDGTNSSGAAATSMTEAEAET